MNAPRFALQRAAALLTMVFAVGCGGSNVNLFPPIDVPTTDDAGDGAPPDVAPPPDAAGDAMTPPDVSSDVARPDAATDATPPDARPDVSSDVVMPPDVTSACTSDRDCATGQSCCGFTGRCYPSACLSCCMFPPPDAGVDATTDAPPGRCLTARDCAAGNECVYASTACATSGVCMPGIACLRAETFCSCAGETYLGCRPDRPTATVGACTPATDAGTDLGGSFCAAALCAAGTVCCEAARACLPRGVLCIAPTDAGVDATVDTGTGTCTSDRDCASGQACCGFTGRCYDTRCLACCMFPPVDAGTTGCTSARDCASGNECVFPTSACAATGTCMSAIACLRPETFCSCAGETYLGCRPDRPTAAVGACSTATDAGVDVGSFCITARCTATTYCCEAARACIPLGALCVAPTDAGAGTCASNADCPTTSYCAGTGCGTPGTCATRPSICTTLFAPVCGCDRVTYSNECTANASGQRVATRGACM